jgi:hypothetical protein
MTPDTVNVEYTCHYCEAKGRIMKVPTRPENQPAPEWINGVLAPIVLKDHADFNCPSDCFDLKIT